MRFSQYTIIAPEIKERLAELSFSRPTDIQYKAIPSIVKGEDLLAVAQTGTGKTAAFVIPILHKIHTRKRHKKSTAIQCLVMVPTHELAQQVGGIFNTIGKNTRVKTLSIFGGISQDHQISQLISGVDVVVATPGRMFDLLSQGYLNLKHIKTLILDEADYMLDLNFIGDIRDMMKHIPVYRQTLFFSATINDKIKKLAYSLVKNPIHIHISPKDPVAKNIEHGVVFIEMDDKRFFLERILKESPSSKFLIFVRTKIRAERILKAMLRVNIQTLTIHSDKEHLERKKVMEQFKSGEIRVLIATDVSARGIDLPDIDYVINYDLPNVAENYVHRVGRTGRGLNKGNAISFCCKEEKSILETIETFLTKEITILDVSKKEYKETLKLSTSVEDDWKKLIKESEKTPHKKGK